MSSRTMLLVPAVLTISAAAICIAVEAKADDCLSKPTGSSPQGSHWYYRIDRATGRQCWYLGVLGTKAPLATQEGVLNTRPAAVSRSTATVTAAARSSANARPPAKARPRPAAAEPADEDTTQAPPPASTRMATPIADQEEAPTTNLAGTWSEVPKGAKPADLPPVPTVPPVASVASVAPVAMSSSYAEETPPTEDSGDMPLIWPVLTAADVAADDAPDMPSVPLAQLGAAVAAMLGLAALIVHLVLGWSRARKAGSLAGDQAIAPVARSTRARRAPARARASRQPADIEVRGLLRELQKQRDDVVRRHFERSPRKAWA